MQNSTGFCEFDRYMFRSSYSDRVQKNQRNAWQQGDGIRRRKSHHEGDTVSDFANAYVRSVISFGLYSQISANPDVLIGEDFRWTPAAVAYRLITKRRLLFHMSD
jgi:hypothetical protein